MGGRLALRRFLVALLFLLVGATLTRANQAARGWCESGAQLVITSGLVSTTQVQASYPSCTVTFFVHGGGLATIYSDNNATPTPLANPFTAQTNGQWMAYAPNGRYDIQLSGAGFPSPVTYSDVTLLDNGAGGIVFGVYSNVVFSPTPIFNAALASIFSITLTGNVTSSSVNSPVQNGQVIEINVCQDATGGRSFVFPPNFLNTSTFTISPTASVCTPTMWFFNGANWLPAVSSQVTLLPSSTIAFSATPSFNATLSAAYSITLTGNVTTSFTTGVPVNGNLLKLHICQGAGSPWTFAFPPNFLNTTAIQTTGCTDETYSFDGINWSQLTQPVGGGGGGGGACSALGSQGTLQAAGTAGACQSTNVSEVGSILTVAEPLVVNGTSLLNGQVTNRGPNLGVDVTAFNARMINLNSVPNTTGTISGSSNSLTVNSATGFLNGDGIAIVGPGATNCGTAPLAPTVTPSLAASMTGTGWTVAGAAGSSPYSYALIATSKGGCYTAAGTIGSTATGNASLGANNMGVTSCSNSLGTVTCVVTSTANLATGTWADLSGTTDDTEFGGRHIITVVDGTHFSFASGISSQYFMTSTTATGGTLRYWVANHLVFPALPAGTGMFQFGVYRCTGASCALPANAANYALVYLGYPASLGFTDAAYNTWDDYGTTMTPALVTGSSAPWFIPATPPATNVNDMLVTTVTNISGTTFTIAPTTACPSGACNSVTSSPMQFDSVPATNAAVAAATGFVSGSGGPIHFPATPYSTILGGTPCYVMSSYLTLAASVSVNQGAPVCLGYTMESAATWTGVNENGQFMTRPGFSMQYEMPIYIKGANPGIWRKGSNAIRNISLQTFGPGTMGIFDNGSGPAITENVNFATDQSASDYMGVLYYYYNDVGGTGTFGGHFTNTSWSAGPVQVHGATDTPLAIFKGGQELTFDYMSGSLRGFYFEFNAANPANAPRVKVHMGEEWQGPITCLFSFNQAEGGNVGGSLYFEGLIGDSGSDPFVCNASTIGSIGAPMFINETNFPASGLPVISGKPWNAGISVIADGPGGPNQIGTNHDLIVCPQSNLGAPVSYTGCRLPALNLPHPSVSANHTLNASEGGVTVTATATITIPHALAGQRWDVHSQAGTTTLAIDSGTLYGNNSTGSFVIPNGSGVVVDVDNAGNAHAAGGGGGGGGGCAPGGSTDALQYNAGGTCAFGGVNSPTVNGNYTVNYNVTASTAVPPTITLPGVPVNAQTGTTYTYLYSDRGSLVSANNAGAQTYTLVNPSTTGFGFNYFNVLKNIGTGAVTEGASGFTINGAASLLVPSLWTRFLWSDGVNYFASRLPDFGAFPNCTGGGNALQFTTSTGAFSCGSASAGVSSFSGDGILLTNVTSTGAVTATLGTAGAHKFWMNNTASTATPGYQSPGKLDLLSTIVYTDQANTYSTGLQNFSSATMEIPTGAGFTAGATSMLGYDSTNKNTHVYANNADAINCAFASSPTTGHLVGETVTSGAVLCTDSGVSTATAVAAVPNVVTANRLSCAQFSGADDSAKIQACLVALAAVNSQAGIADATGLSGLTWSLNPFAAGSLPASGELWLPPGDIVITVPVVKPDAWIMKGIGGRSVTGQYGTNLKASASWAPTYSTGTITKGTAGVSDVITGSGTTWNSTNTPIGCAFVGGTQPNVTYGIISANSSTTSITLKWGTDNGTGAAAASTYAIFCPLVVMGGGGASNAGAQFGIQERNYGVDGNNIAGAVGFLNWYAQEQSRISNVAIRGFTNIGLQVEGQAQNSGPYEYINFAEGSSCTASTIPAVFRSSAQPMMPLKGWSISKGTCATSPTVGVDAQTNNLELQDINISSAVTGISIGANTSCPVACANPPRLTNGVHVTNARNISSSGTTLVTISNAFGTPDSTALDNLAQTGITNILIDSANSCTSTKSRLGSYKLDSAGAIAFSTDKTAGCFVPYGQVIASGTAVMGTSAISSGACATVVTSAGTGIATTDVITVGFNTDPTAITGYGASATGAVLTIYPYPTANNANFKVCNSSSGSITPGALTLNWKVVR
jgi:hypothetical protein